MSFRSDFIRALPQLTLASFEAAALALFRHQAAHCPPYAAYLAQLRRAPAAVARLADIPFLPIEFFKTHEVRTAPAEWQPQEEFLSSGTTLQQRSRHLVREPALYRQNAARIFEQYYGPLTGWTFLALLPSYLEQGQFLPGGHGRRISPGSRARPSPRFSCTTTPPCALALAEAKQPSPAAASCSSG